MKKLDKMVKGLTQKKRREVDVDVSQWFGNEEDGSPVKFRYRESDVAELFQGHADAEEIRAANPTWPQRLCQVVSMLAAAHVSPESDEPIGLMYCRIASTDGDLLLHLSANFLKAFPAAQALETATETAKNASSTASTA